MHSFKIIQDTTGIDELFKNLARQKEIAVLVTRENAKFHGIMVFQYKTALTPFIRFTEEFSQPAAGQEIEISFFYRDTCFMFQSKVTSIQQDRMGILFPEQIRASFDRGSTRYSVSKSLEFHLRFEDGQTCCEVRDLSTSGLSIESVEKLFPEGTIVRNAVLNLDSSTEIHFDAAVKYVKPSKNGYRAGLRFITLDWESRQLLFQYIFEKQYPDLKPLSSFCEEDIARLYEEVSSTSLVTSTLQKRLFITRFSRLKEALIHPLISAGLVFCKSNRLLAAGSALRIFNNTFFHYPVLLPPETRLNPRAKGELLSGLTETLISHPYFDHFLTFGETGSDGYQEIFGEMSRIILDNRHYSMDFVSSYDFSTSDHLQNPPPKGYTAEIHEDPSEFLTYCAIHLSPLENACYCYDKARFTLEQIKEVYLSLGHSVNRRLFSIKCEAMTSAFAVAECFSVKEDADSMINTLRLYIIDRKAPVPALISTVLHHAVTFFKMNGIRNFKLLLPAVDQLENIQIPGLGSCHPLLRVMMDKDGLCEFHGLLTANFKNFTRFFNLTQPQKALWMVEKVFPGTSIGNVSGTLKIKEAVDCQLFEKAINSFIEKNDAMRFRMLEENGEPKQYIREYSYFKVDFFDFSYPGGEKDLYRWDTEQTQIPFSLHDSDLYYFAILKLGNDSYCAYVKAHHMILDAWAMNLLCSQVIETYHCLKNGEAVPESCKPSYVDYIQDEEEYRYSDKFNKNRDYWLGKFDHLREFRSVKPVPQGFRSTRAERKTFVLPCTLNQKIRLYCTDNKLSIFTIFMAALTVYLGRRTGCPDVVIGTPVLNRSGAKEKETIGLFVSTIPVLLTAGSDTDFASFVRYVARELSACYKNQKYNHELILKDYRERFHVDDRLYDCMLSYQNSKYEKGGNAEAYETRWHFNKNQVESLVIHIDDREDEGQYLINMDYMTDLFTGEEINQCYEDLLELMDTGLCEPHEKIGLLGKNALKEKANLLDTLTEFNDTMAPYPKDKTIHQMFEDQVKESPDSTAIVFGNQSLTYGELNRKANQLARTLRSHGASPDQVIGIMLYRSFEMIIGILGILKAGSAYLPIDPDYPGDRKKYMLENGNVQILLTKGETGQGIAEGILTLDLEKPGTYSENGDNLECVNSPRDLAYVIYTSGSTGKPKGAMIEHHSVINRLHWMQKRYPLSPGDVILQKTPYTFDVSVWELFWWGFYGAKMAFLSPGGEKEPSKVIEAICQHQVSVLHFVPSMLGVFLDYLEKGGYSEKIPPLRQVFASGEALTVKHYERFFTLLDAQKVSLSNLYGPTEATVDVSYFDCRKEDDLKSIPIGKPIDNIRLYVMNEQMEPVAPGIPGELYIAGDGLARGYLGAPEITAEKFVYPPCFSGERMYRTGDLSKWLPDGNIEYLGRMDGQVKIHGLRIELGEIEYQLLRHTGIREAVVVDRRDQQENHYLCAYYVSETDIPISELRSHLTRDLPIYMLPSYFVRMDAFPLSTNGKIDRKKLPEPFDYILAEEEYIAPRTELEKLLAGIWQEFLNREKIGIRDNFFHLGGDSLKAVQIVSRMGEKLSISDIYSYPTIEDLARKISQGGDEDSLLYTALETRNRDFTSLVCVPYGGGVSIVYNELGAALKSISDSYALYSVKLPGHDTGGNPGDFKPIEEVASACAEKIKQLAGKNLILYGHCVGSALTVEIARLLEADGHRVKAVIIGGIIPPKLVNLYGHILDPWKWQKDDGIIKHLNKLGGVESAFGKEELSSVLQAFRHDVRCFMKYFHDFSKEKHSKLTMPLYCIMGGDDPSTRGYGRKYREWMKFFRDVRLITLKDASHYFVKTHAGQLARIIDNISWDTAMGESHPIEAARLSYEEVSANAAGEIKAH